LSYFVNETSLSHVRGHSAQSRRSWCFWCSWCSWSTLQSPEIEAALV